MTPFFRKSAKIGRLTSILKSKMTIFDHFWRQMKLAPKYRQKLAAEKSPDFSALGLVLVKCGDFGSFLVIFQIDQFPAIFGPKSPYFYQASPKTKKCAKIFSRLVGRLFRPKNPKK